MARKIQLKRLAHIYYQYPDLEKAAQFLQDFGFTEVKRVSEEYAPDKIYFRGYGTEPWVLCAVKGDKAEFCGGAFVVESEADLKLADETLPDSSGIYQLADVPGGGKCVTFMDPVDGFPFHLVHGQKSVEPLPITFVRNPVNYPTEKNRPANKFQRFEKRPAPVHKLGHFGVKSTDFAKAYDFYCTHFNFVASDLVHNAAGVVELAFLRLERGGEQVDHHSFFLAQAPFFGLHHSSYETYDFDTQVLGHDWLRQKGYENCWGVGRHVLGSQIFDYWFDPSGFIMEHYVDGDLLTADEPTHRSQSGPGSLHVWGPDVPLSFLK